MYTKTEIANRIDYRVTEAEATEAIEPAAPATLDAESFTAITALMGL